MRFDTRDRDVHDLTWDMEGSPNSPGDAPLRGRTEPRLAGLTQPVAPGGVHPPIATFWNSLPCEAWKSRSPVGATPTFVQSTRLDLRP